MFLPDLASKLCDFGTATRFPWWLLVHCLEDYSAYAKEAKINYCGKRVQAPRQCKVEGQSAVYWAALGRLDKILHMQLKKKNVDVNACYGALGSALNAAAAEGPIETVRLLLRAGAHVDGPVSLRFGSALQLAALRGQKNVVEILLDAREM